VTNALQTFVQRIVDGSSKHPVSRWLDLGDSAARAGLKWLRESLGMKLNVVGHNTVKGEEGKAVSVFALDMGDPGLAHLRVCTELLGALQAYCFYRKRDATLVAALRARSRMFCKEWGISDMDSCLFMPGTVALALYGSPQEESGFEAMRALPLRFAAQQTGDLASGYLPARAQLTGWDSWKAVFGLVEAKRSYKPWDTGRVALAGT